MFGTVYNDQVVFCNGMLYRDVLLTPKVEKVRMAITAETSKMRHSITDVLFTQGRPRSMMVVAGGCSSRKSICGGT